MPLGISRLITMQLKLYNKQYAAALNAEGVALITLLHEGNYVEAAKAFDKVIENES